MAKVLGINTSHDTAICSMTDGKIDYYHEEGRMTRDKHWCMRSGVDEVCKDGELVELKYESDEMERWKTLDFAFGKDNELVETFDTIGIASFDRRIYQMKFRTLEVDEDGNPREIKKGESIYPSDEEKTRAISYLEDRAMFNDLRQHIIEEPITRERIAKGQEYFNCQGFPVLHPFEFHDIDTRFNDTLLGLYGVSEYDFLQNEHHLLHAFAGLYQSPFKDALILVCDGGGSKYLWDEFPCYQEMESMFYLSDQDITPLYKHLSNSRFTGDMNVGSFDQDYFSHNKHFDLDNMPFDIRLSSEYSEGQKFSALSSILGFDEHGRAAGKVMGMASYGLDLPIKQNYTAHGLSGMLQNETVEHTKKLLERLVEYKPECKNIILSGGYALNCVGNYKYLEMFPNHNFFIDPCAHDGGTAIGSCVKNTFYQDKGYTL